MSMHQSRALSRQGGHERSVKRGASISEMGQKRRTHPALARSPCPLFSKTTHPPDRSAAVGTPRRSGTTIGHGIIDGAREIAPSLMTPAIARNARGSPAGAARASWHPGSGSRADGRDWSASCAPFPARWTRRPADADGRCRVSLAKARHGIMSAREGRGFSLVELVACLFRHTRPCIFPVFCRRRGAHRRRRDASEMAKQSQIEKRNAFNARSQNGGQGQRTDERAGKMPKRSQTEKLRDFKGAGCRCRTAGWRTGAAAR